MKKRLAQVVTRGILHFLKHFSLYTYHFFCLFVCFSFLFFFFSTFSLKRLLQATRNVPQTDEM